MNNLRKNFRNQLGLFLLAAVALLHGGRAWAVTETFTISGTYSWTAPAGVTSVRVEVWGGGGGGGGQYTSTSDGGGGGGGGGYSMSTVTVVPGTAYTVSATVGAGGAGGTGTSGAGGVGGDSSCTISATTVTAKGGAGGARSTGTPPAGGIGGSAAGGTGTTKFSGGNGGKGRDNSTGQGGPGGSSAGIGADGTSGLTTWTTVKAQAAPVGGGIGGNGGTLGGDGLAPVADHGGGGGGSGEGTTSAPRSGGAGAAGKVTLSYGPVVITNAASNLSSTAARLNGTVSSNGADTSASFEYGLTTAYGNNITATPASLLANAPATAITADVSNLSCNTHHFRAKGVNSAGTSYGNDAIFATSADKIEFNTTGGSSATNGLHFYIEDSTKIQVTRLNGTGQVYYPGSVPPSTSLDNGVFLRANGLVYGPGHDVTSPSFAPNGGDFDAMSICPTSPANPSTPGVQQSAAAYVGINAGPQVNIVWKYTTPLEFLTAEVTLTIPAGYPVSAANPVRYYHVIDTYLGGSDQGCGVKYTDSNGKLVVGTYPPTSGSTCPSSTSLPPGATIVESFRERSGTFSKYCVAGWSSFYTLDSSKCAISEVTALSNTITTTYIDTGVGIEYDFTAAGTYRFSYDFVIGSPIVPPYDHLEIRHDGLATLCPEAVTVLACTSATVPCPDENRVSTGMLTGTLTTTPTSPATTKTPTTFELGSARLTQAINLQATAAGSITLGASGLSSIPLNGIKCWNTATSSQNCTLTFDTTPCVNGFDCLETGSTLDPTATRNPLYTKLSGTDFQLDVVALQSSGAQANSYTAANVWVDLYDDSASPDCSAASALASQSIVFAASGRQTTSAFNLPNAYLRLRCRVRDTNLSVNACSSDAFTVRPPGFSDVNSSTTASGFIPANADSINGVSSTNTPVIRAGNAFSLAADTSRAGYDGTPKIDPLKIEWPGVPAGGRTAPPGTGTLAGSFTTAASVSTGNGARGDAFTYNEVGYFRFQAGGVYDDTWVRDSGSADVTNGDCTNDFSNTPVGGKYGCKFGNTNSDYVGRFIPDSFVASNVTVKPRSDLTDLLTGLPSCSASAFTYLGEPMRVTGLTLTAKAAGGSTTQNYAGTFSNLDLKSSATTGVANLKAGAQHGTAPSFTNFYNASASLNRLDAAYGGSSFTDTYPNTDPDCPNTKKIAWCKGRAVMDVDLTIKRPATGQDGPFAGVVLGISPVDADGVKMTGVDFQRNYDGTSALAADGKILTTLTGNELRFGRLRLQNAFGSELLALDVPVQAQYWNGSGFVVNAADSCTALTVPTLPTLSPRPVGSALDGVPALYFYTADTTVNGKNKLASGDTAVTAASPLTAGKTNLHFTQPSKRGWLDLILDVPEYLKFNWANCSGQPGAAGLFDDFPCARATFGTYNSKSPVIYRRENY